MKSLLLLFILFPFVSFSQSTNSVSLLSEEQKKETYEIVKIWIDELFKAENVNQLMQISDVPFAFDRNRILNTTDDLKKVYEQIIEDKEKREIPKYEIQILDFKNEILDTYIPLNYIKVGIIVGEGDHREDIIICVLMRNNTLKIVGFSD